MKPKSPLPFPSPAGAPTDLAERLRNRLIGQDDAIEAIVPYVEIFQARLSPPGRPAGVFMLLGPTGTGKTKTVEALAECLHGSPSKLLRIDCGEFQLDHEVAKLIGAPPGYLGHRETAPMLTQQKVNAATGDECQLSLVLFDEIEKAAPSMQRLLLGVLDKAVLRLGDSTSVDFQRCLIFFTSNSGTARLAKEATQPVGFAGAPPSSDRLSQRALRAMQSEFPPEFVNRIDRTIVYRQLSDDSLEAILDLELSRLRTQMQQTLGVAAPVISVAAAARQALLAEGASREYGARELKRVLHRRLLHPLALNILRSQVGPGARVTVSATGDAGGLTFEMAA